MSHMNQTQAADRAQQHVDAAVAALHLDVPALPVGIAPAPCDNLDGTPSNRIQVAHQVRITGLSAEQRRRAAQRLRDYWAGNGYRIRQPLRLGDYPELYGQNVADTFNISLTTGGDGAIYLVSSSVCVERDPIPIPE